MSGGPLLSDDEARQVAHDAALSAYTLWSDRPPEPVDADVAARNAVDERARALAENDVEVGRVKSLMDQGLTVVAIDQAGRPLPDSSPTRSLGDVLELMAQRPGVTFGAACGPDPAPGLVVLAIGEQGWAWLKAVALEPLPRDYDPADDDSTVPNRRFHREPCGLPVLLREGEPIQMPRFRSVSLPLGRRGRELAESFRRPLAPPQQRWLAWSWPQGWRLPIGRRVATDGELVAAVPASGGRIERDGRYWSVLHPVGLGSAQAMPPWLASALGGKVA